MKVRTWKKEAAVNNCGDIARVSHGNVDGPYVALYEQDDDVVAELNFVDYEEVERFRTALEELLSHAPAAVRKRPLEFEVVDTTTNRGW